MAELFKESFDFYGAGIGLSTNAVMAMKAGRWADVAGGSTGIGSPPWGARTGSYCLVLGGTGAHARYVLPAPTAELIVMMGYALPSLPTSNDQLRLIDFNDGSNVNWYRVVCQSTGVLSFQKKNEDNSNFTELGVTQAPVIVPENWPFIGFEIDTVSGTFRIDYNGDTVMNLTGLSLESHTIAQIRAGFIVGTGQPNQYVDDLHVWDTSGSRNNSLEPDLRIATLFLNADTEVANWTQRPRKKIGNGILDNRTTNACVSAPSSVQTDLGSGDYTIEQFVRFATLPTGSNKAVIFGKWDETNNRRSYQLYLGGPDLDSGHLIYRISTDGQAGTVDPLVSWPWVPDLHRWYHLAVSRVSGETLLFIDGVQIGVPVVDANSYYAGVEPTVIGGQLSGASSAVANTSLSGFLDEVRLTVGLARYTADFAVPTAPFGRNVTDDPSFASVALLCGFDSGVNDESGFGRLMTARSGALQNTPDDGDFLFQCINQATPRDDTFVEAALLPAASILTMDALPTDGETVTVGEYGTGPDPAVYKFVNSLTDPFDVLIGADVPETLANLENAINLGPGDGTAYGTGTEVNLDVLASSLPEPQMLVTALTPGSAGNSIASTSTASDAGWTGATLSGGQDIPGPSEFRFDRPPPLTTVVKSLTIVSRMFKSDSGTCDMQLSLVGPQGGADHGLDGPITVSTSYRSDTFEEDPDTSGDLTPTTLVGGRVRLNRTA